MNPCPFVSLFLSIVHQLDFTPSGCNAAGPWQFSVQCEVAEAESRRRSNQPITIRNIFKAHCTHMIETGKKRIFMKV